MVGGGPPKGLNQILLGAPKRLGPALTRVSVRWAAGSVAASTKRFKQKALLFYFTLLIFVYFIYYIHAIYFDCYSTHSIGTGAFTPYTFDILCLLHYCFYSYFVIF